MRRLHDCKQPFTLPEAALLKEGFTAEEIPHLHLYDALGCSACNEGYKGRIGVYQVMPITESIGQIILEGGGAAQIANRARTEGIRDLRQSALLKLKNGLSSLSEINRVTKD